jgi:TatD DNase family protein
MLIDVHCHFNELADSEQVLAAAKEKDVKIIISNSVDLASMQQNLALAQKLKEIECGLGLHPSNALRLTPEERKKTMSFLKQNLAQALVVGETGLDFKHAQETEQQEMQADLFKEHLLLGKEHNKAVEAHSRQARKQVLELIEENEAEKVLLHWFVAKGSITKRALDLSCFISIGPSILFSEELNKFVRKLPLENLLLETDSPVPFQGKPAQPAWIKDIAQKVAQIKEIELQELERQITDNAKRLFNLKI